MAIIKCPECGKEISDKAVSCPNCGAPIIGMEVEYIDTRADGQISSQRGKIIVGILIIGLLIGIAYLIFVKFNLFGNKLDDVEKSVVTVYCYNSSNELIASGSGFIVQDSNTIVTNYHVVDGAYFLKISTDTGAEYDASEFVAYSEKHDLAILKIEGNTQLQPLEIYEGKIEKGDKVVAIGSPLGIQNTISEGIVSGIRTGVMDDYDIIQTTAPFTHGSSGGALFDNNYRVIGVTYSGIDQEGNLNFAIPIKAVSELLSSHEKEFDTVSELYRANLMKTSDGHTCVLKYLDINNIHSIYEWSNSNSYSEGYQFVYGYFSCNRFDGIYLYEEKGMVTGNEEFDFEYYQNARQNGNNNIMRIMKGYTDKHSRTGGMKSIRYHDNTAYDVGDLVIVCYSMPDGDAIEIIDAEGMDIL